LSRVDTRRVYGVSNAANRATLVNFVEVGKTVINEETVVHLHKINEAKHNINMVKETIGVLLLRVKVVKTMRKRSSIHFAEGGMPKVNVGPKGKVMVVVIVAEVILRTNVVNWTRLLVYLTRWPIHNNKRETT
jgi:hypothetical protein